MRRINRGVYLFVFIIFTSALCSCNKTSTITGGEGELKESNESPGGNQTIKLKEAREITPQLKGDPELLYFEGETVIFGCDTVSPDNADCADVQMYYYNIDNAALKLITKIKNLNMTFCDIKKAGGYLYYPYQAIINREEKNRVAVIDEKTMTKVKTNAEDEREFAVDMDTAGNALLKLYLIDGSEEKDYYIDIINHKQRETIVHSRYSKGEGEGIISIYSDQNKIYAYTYVSRNHVSDYFISQYNLNGELEKKTPLRAGSFLYMDEVDDTDSIFDLYKRGNYFLLHTINSRNLIVKQNGEEWIPIPVPEDLEDLNKRATVIENGKESRFVYFQCIANPERIYVFDTAEEKFYTYILETEADVLKIYVDSGDNVIVAAKNQNTESQFYLIENFVSEID